MAKEKRMSKRVLEKIQRRSKKKQEDWRFKNREEHAKTQLDKPDFREQLLRSYDKK
jgi:hypothetical protein